MVYIWCIYGVYTCIKGAYIMVGINMVMKVYKWYIPGVIGC